MDFYAVLGLEPGASAAEIKRAYRRLSRRYHPGINPGDRAAEALFHRISEAYETLVDPQRRQQYDTGGGQASPRTEPATFEFSGFDFSVAAHGSQAATFSELFADVLNPLVSQESGRAEVGSDLHAAVTISFEDSIRGIERQVVVTRQIACNACGGAGQLRTPEARCAHCHATGKVRWARGHMVFSKPCLACGGTGRIRQQRCDVCIGHGRLVRSEAVGVRIPPGVPDGARLRLPEKGHSGRHNGRTGDLYVTVHVQPHPVFRREGDDLFVSVPVAVHEAVLGARIDVPAFDGPIKLRVPPGTQGGHRFRLSGRGVPASNGGRGDLIIEIQLVLPSIVSERSKELMREFGRINGEDVRRELKL